MTTDPSLTLVTTTATLPREGEGASEEMKRLRLQAKLAERYIELAELRKLYREMKEELSRRNAKIDDQHGDICARRKEAERLTDTLAQRDETIAEFKSEKWFTGQREYCATLESTIASLRAQLADHEHVAADLRERLEGALTQLAQAGAIEEAAKVSRLAHEVSQVLQSRTSEHIEDEAIDSWSAIPDVNLDELSDAWAALASPSPGPEAFAKPVQCPCGEIAVRVDTGACARCGRPAGDSSPGPRGTPEGERLAKLERVAQTGRAFGTSRGDDHFAKLRDFQLALADLDATEVKS